MTNLQINRLLTDEAILQELGARLTARRIELHMTQEAVAKQAGVSKRTLERLEAGHPAQSLTLVRVLRVLDGLSQLDGLLKLAGPRPTELLKRAGKTPQRASSRRKTAANKKPWTWGE